MTDKMAMVAVACVGAIVGDLAYEVKGGIGLAYGGNGTGLNRAAFVLFFVGLAILVYSSYEHHQRCEEAKRATALPPYPAY